MVVFALTGKLSDFQDGKAYQGHKEIFESTAKETNNNTDDMVAQNGFYDYSAAAREGDLVTLKQCNKKDANRRDEDGMTPTHWAALYGNLEALRMLVIAGGSPDKTNNEGSSSLHLAAGNGHLPCLVFLTNFGGNVHALNDTGDSPMHEASNKSQLECVRHLEAIVTHQVSQDRQRVDKMQQRAKKDTEKRLKEKQKLLTKIDKSYDKKAAKQRKYIGVPLSSNPNNPYNSDGSDRMSYSQLTGMNGHALSQASGDLNEYESNLDNDSIDSFQRAEDEFLTRSSQVSDDIVFERPEKSSIRTEHTDMSASSSSAEIPIRSAGMVASLNSLHTKNGGAEGGLSRSPYISSGRQHHQPASDGGYPNGSGTQHYNGYPRNSSVSLDSGRRQQQQQQQQQQQVRNNKKATANGKSFGVSQHLGSSSSASTSKFSSYGNVPPSQRTGRPVGFVEVHMGPLYTFLHSLDMDEFRETFLREKIDLRACLLCDENDLREIGLPLGPRKKLMDAIKRRNQIMEQAEQKSELFDSAV